MIYPNIYPNMHTHTHTNSPEDRNSGAALPDTKQVLLSKSL